MRRRNEGGADYTSIPHPRPRSLGSHSSGKQAICVLGMHRSGTSVTARAIELLGAYMGRQEELELGGSDNPEGFWERRSIHSLHERILEQFGMSWDTTVKLPRGWLQSKSLSPFREELTAIIGADFASHPVWAWKDPRTSLLLPLWREVLAEMAIELKCLMIIRHPIEVARSLERRNGFTIERSLAIWLNYNLSALENSARSSRALIAYGDLLADSRGCLAKSLKKIGLSGCLEDDRVWSTIDRVVKRPMQHSRYTEADLVSCHPSVRRLALELSNAVQAASLDVAEARLRQTGLLDFRLRGEG